MWLVCVRVVNGSVGSMWLCILCSSGRWCSWLFLFSGVEIMLIVLGVVMVLKSCGWGRVMLD